ncbi:PAS domain S-box protein [Thermodesulfobacteriota bacterium]
MISAFFTKTSVAMIILALSIVISPMSRGQERQSQENVTPRKVRVGLYENKPKVFTDETGRPSGIFIDLLEQIAREEKWELEYLPCKWPECLKALEEGRLDLMPDAAFSQERSKKLDFHEMPVLESWSQVYTNKRASVKKLADLDGHSLALLEGSIQQHVLEQMMNGFGFEITFVPTKTYEEAFSLASDGSVDAVVTNHFFGNYYYQEYGLVKTTIILNPVSLYFVTAKGRNPGLLKAIDRRLEIMKSGPGSPYYKVLGQWMESPPTVIVPGYLFWIIGGIGGFLAMAFVIIIILRVQVRSRTRHLAQANETLRKSEEKFRTLFETMEQGVVYQNADGDIISANPAAERILGLSSDEMLGRKSTDPRWKALSEDGSPFPGEDHPAMVAMRTGKGVGNVIMGIYSPKDNETRWILVDATPDYAQGEKKPHQVYTIFTDITERKLAEERLRNQHSELKQIFDTLPDALVYVDTQERIMRVNPAFERIFGFESSEVTGKKTEMLYARMEDFEEQKKRKSNEGSHPFHEPYETDYRRANGDIFRGETVGSPICDSKGKLMGTFSLVRDITESRKLEGQLQQAQKMESVGRLAGGVAHDFNNLLSVIIGYGELVFKDLQEDHQHYKPLDQIIQAGVRAKELTRQLLAFSRKQVLEMRSTDVNKVVAGFQRLLQRVIGEDITLELNLAAEPCKVLADTSQIEQVLMNLSVNARDAMPHGGKLTIEVALTDLDEGYATNKPDVTPGKYVMISLSDTGHGMDAGTLEHIFEPFFTTKRKEKGTGLGLATSFGIIKQHGGSIWVYSEPQKGTTFRIYLPFCEEEVVSKEVDPAAPVNLKGSETILVVEDNKEVRDIALNILSSYGYTVMSADSGESALKILESHVGPLDLLLTDVVMPGINGKELFERISDRFFQLKVIYMSGYTDNLIAHHGVLEKGVHFVQKPFSVQSLVTKVRVTLDGD